jgi:hypothetical protein
MNAMAKSLPLAALAPLARVPNVAFYSLQKFAGAHDPAAHVPPQGLRLVDWTAELADFADTSALVAALDLVISVDTSVAHLAGALGKRVWVLLPANADWRYLRGARIPPGIRRCGSSASGRQGSGASRLPRRPKRSHRSPEATRAGAC